MNAAIHLPTIRHKFACLRLSITAAARDGSLGEADGEDRNLLRTCQYCESAAVPRCRKWEYCSYTKIEILWCGGGSNIGYHTPFHYALAGFGCNLKIVGHSPRTENMHAPHFLDDVNGTLGLSRVPGAPWNDCSTAGFCRKVEDH